MAQSSTRVSGADQPENRQSPYRRQGRSHPKQTIGKSAVGDGLHIWQEPVCQRCQDHRADGDHLDRGFEFGEHRYRNADFRAGEKLAQAGDQNLACENDQCGNEFQESERTHDQIELVYRVFCHDHHQRHGHQNLVGDGVEHSSEFGAGVELARRQSVERVADSGDAEHGERNQARGIAGSTKASANTGTRAMRMIVMMLGTVSMDSV